MVGALNHALMITGFVFVMMVVIEYVNILTSGTWQRKLSGRWWGQYLVAGLLGATPGCLGAFVVVAMYSHRTVTMGALVTAMIATSGDESFVMLAMMPKQFLLVNGLLLGIGIPAGILTDLSSGWRKTGQPQTCTGFRIHEEEACRCFAPREILAQWKKCSAHRGVLGVVLLLFVFGVLSGQVGPPSWNWIRISVLSVSVLSLFIVTTVPEHFLEEHLWKHVARQHVPRIFLWTFGTLAALHVLVEHLRLEEIAREGQWALLLAACLTGLIPESGPHLLFVTLYVQGMIPFSILLASSIVQDGHGMLPVLAHSKKAFAAIKTINLAIGLACGAIGLLWRV